MKAKHLPKDLKQAKAFFVRLSMVVIIILTNIAISNATTKTWNLATGGAWTNGNNWSPLGAPGANDDVIINGASTAITAVPTIQLNSLTINGNCVLRCSADGNTITVNGTFSVPAGITLTMGNVAGTRAVFILNGTGTINGTFNLDAGAGGAEVFTNNGTLIMGPNGLLSGGCGFTLASSATLEVGSTAGITRTGANGNIQCGGTRTYTSGANYFYNNGSADQVTGNGLTQNVPANVTIDDPGDTVSLTGNTNMSGILTVTAGSTLQLSTYNLGGATPPTSVVLYCGAVSGSTITNTTGILVLGGDVTVLSAVTGTSGATISAHIDLGSDRTFTVADDGSSAVDLTVSGTISGAYGITKDGPGTMNLSGANTYTGTTTINEGTLQLGSNTALGTVAGGTVVNSGAVLDLNGIHYNTRPEPLTINGSGISNGGVLINSSSTGAIYHGQITLGSNSTISPTGNITLGANGITGGFDLTISGTGGLNMGSGSITLGNLYNNTTLESTSGTLYISGDFVNNGGFLNHNGMVEYNGFGSQNVAGGENTTYYDLYFYFMGVGDFPSGTVKTFTASVIVNDNLSIDFGAVVDLGTYTSNTNTLTLGGAGTVAGSWGSSGSPATYVNDTYFNPPDPGILNVATPSCTPPNPPLSDGDQAICFGQSVPALTVTVNYGETADWYDSPSGGTLLASNTTSYTPSGAGTFYAEARNTTTQCVSLTRTGVTLTINALPVPTLSGNTNVCAGSSGNTYTTESGMSNYNWVLSAGGGTITGGGAETITVTWTSSGTQTVSVNYTDTNGCTAASQTVYDVLVNPIPTVDPVSNQAVCNGSVTAPVNFTGSVPGTVFNWTNDTPSIGLASSGTGDIASFTATNPTNTPVTATVTVTPQTTYYPSGVIANPGFETGTFSSWTIQGTIPMPVVNSLAPHTGTYSAFLGNPPGYEPYGDASFYQQVTVPAGGGTLSYWYLPYSEDNIYFDWQDAYITDLSGNILVTVMHVCSNTQVWTNVTYDMAAFAGQTVRVMFLVHQDGFGDVTNMYVDDVSLSSGIPNCIGTPTSFTITVNPLPVPTISGAGLVCNNSTGNIYTTQAGMSGYTWTVTGGTITSGSGTASITVTWNVPGVQTISVNYTDGNGCTAPSPGSETVIVVPLPTPTISGPNDVCANSTGNIYTTESGNSSYTWSISAGGTITSGGTSTDNTVTVTWNTVGAQTVSVSYLNAFGCAPISPSVYNVTVNPRALPTLSGPASVCLNSTGNIYTTEGGNTNYIWSVSAGGTITAGGGTNNNTVTVTWHSTGAQTVSVSYTNAFGCTTVTPTVYNVTVNALPSPTIAGPASVCAGSTGNVYTTQAGNTNYIWVVSAGGTITAGGTTNSTSVTVTWNTAGAQTVSVNYTNGNGCTAAAPTIYNVTVNALPTPTIAGPTPVCAGTTGNLYTTQAGNTNYIWSVSAGGTITAGGTTNSSSVTVTWNTTGAQTVSVNYTNGTGCTAAAPTVYNVTVNPTPSPTISGPASVCATSTGNLYLTETGMNNYVWSVSAGGTITGGGGSGNSFVIVTWNTAGAQTVSVNYHNASGCTAPSPTVYNVTVNPLPVPTIAGPTPVCVISSGNVYTTQAGMTNYIWAVSAGGVITAGGTTSSSSVTVTWNTVGAQTVSVNYTNSNGCTAAAPTVFNVTANPTPAPTLAGPTPVCAGSTGNVYTTQAGNTNYIWAVSAGGTITAGGTTNSSTVTVTWNTAGAQTVSVDYTNGSGCTAPSPTVYNVTVNAQPTPTIAGPTPVCAGATGNVYTTQAGMTNYIWAVSAGGTITAGGTTNSNTVTVTWNTAGAQTVSVNYTNSNGCTAAAPTVFNVTVNALPVPTHCRSYSCLCRRHR